MGTAATGTAIFSSKFRPQNWLCQSAGGAAPSGLKAAGCPSPPARAWTACRCAASGGVAPCKGSAVREATSVEAISSAAPGHVQQRAGGVTRIIRQQPQDAARHFIGCAGALHGHLRRQLRGAELLHRRIELEQRVDQVHALAQLGIVVEIIGHELNELDQELRRHMRRLPKAVQASEPFVSAATTQRKLFDQLRFLAPMQLSGRRLREEITGLKLFEYVRSFFTAAFEARGVSFTASERFCALQVTEYPSRLQPVFINLVNNSLYWLSQNKPGNPRKILLDLIDDNVIVSDSGPGVDPEDIPRLFQLFYSRRTEGRGVGLYLCRMNLEMGGHSIYYGEEPRHRLLSGAR